MRLSGNGFRISQPNGTYFTYLHMSAFADGLGVGSPVTAGQVIGYVGKTGNAATPHLHFEVHPNGGGRGQPVPVGQGGRRLQQHRRTLTRAGLRSARTTESPSHSNGRVTTP